MINPNRRLTLSFLFLCAAFAIGSSKATASYNAPLITSINLTSSNPLTAGGAVSYSYTITKGSGSGISAIYLQLTDPLGRNITLSDSSGATSGTLSTTTTSNWINGAYTVSVVYVVDTNSYQSYYYPDGSVNYNNGAIGPMPPNTLGLSASGFTLSGGLNSYNAPQITAINLTSSNPVTAGGTVSYSYSITKGSGSGISAIYLQLTDPLGMNFTLSDSSGATSGTLSMASTGTWINGAYTVSVVYVVDTNSYQSYY